MTDPLTFKALTEVEWPDFVKLFEEHGIQDGCWCMYWRVKRAEYQRHYGEDNKLAFKEIVDAGNVPGILAYLDRHPAGWCSIAPRETFPVLERSPTLKRVDQLPVWSIVCFFISKPYRRLGMTQQLIRAAIQYAGRNGAKIIEAYPLRTELIKMLPYERFMGNQSTFERLGFNGVIQRSDRRPIMRYTINQADLDKIDSHEKFTAGQSQ
jgi:GNAT superfamily N-acetyltransferase